MKKEKIIYILMAVSAKYKWAIAKPVTDRMSYMRALSRENLQEGLCSAIKAQLDERIGFCRIYDELTKDCAAETVDNAYWYQTPLNLAASNFHTVKIKSDTLQPRYNHLNRTISRLQHELKLEAHG